MSDPRPPATWPSFGWIVAIVCLILAILLPFLGRMDLTTAIVIAAISSHRL